MNGATSRKMDPGQFWFFFQIVGSSGLLLLLLCLTSTLASNFLWNVVFTFSFNHATLQMKIGKIICNSLTFFRGRILHDFTISYSILYFTWGFRCIRTDDIKDTFHNFISYVDKNIDFWYSGVVSIIHRCWFFLSKGGEEKRPLKFLLYNLNPHPDCSIQPWFLKVS